LFSALHVIGKELVFSLGANQLRWELLHAFYGNLFFVSE
jgi:hypothetical protein